MSFVVRPGEIVGYLGPKRIGEDNHGAGMLTGLGRAVQRHRAVRWPRRAHGRSLSGIAGGLAMCRRSRRPTRSCRRANRPRLLGRLRDLPAALLRTEDERNTVELFGWPTPENSRSARHPGHEAESPDHRCLLHDPDGATDEPGFQGSTTHSPAPAPPRRRGGARVTRRTAGILGRPVEALHGGDCCIRGPLCRTLGRGEQLRQPQDPNRLWSSVASSGAGDEREQTARAPRTLGGARKCELGISSRVSRAISPPGDAPPARRPRGRAGGPRRLLISLDPSDSRRGRCSRRARRPRSRIHGA